MNDGLETLVAQVRCIAGSKVGLQFAQPIHDAVFDLLIARLA
jgi:hypothetical protein